MEYKHILSSNQISLKTFYIENPMIAMVYGAKGEICINGQTITVTTNLTLIIPKSVSYTHLRAHETGRNLVCRLLLEKKKTQAVTA